MKKETMAEEFGIFQTNAIMHAAHMTYNARRGKRMVEVCIEILQKRINEIQPKKADPKYKKARYGKSKKAK